MSLKFWALAARVAGLVISSKTVLDASRTVLGSLKREYRDIEDERLREYLVNLEHRVKAAETGLAQTRKTVNRLTTALYALAALALAAIALALIRPA